MILIWRNKLLSHSGIFCSDFFLIPSVGLNSLLVCSLGRVFLSHDTFVGGSRSPWNCSFIPFAAYTNESSPKALFEASFPWKEKREWRACSIELAVFLRTFQSKFIRPELCALRIFYSRGRIPLVVVGLSIWQSRIDKTIVPIERMTLFRVLRSFVSQTNAQLSWEIYLFYYLFIWRYSLHQVHI